VHEDGSYEVTGNKCKRGYEFVVNEYEAPVRMLTTTVKVAGGLHARLPVVSTLEVPKGQLFECLSYLYRVEVMAPVRAGDIVVENILGTGAAMVAGRDIPTASD